MNNASFSDLFSSRTEPKTPPKTPGKVSTISKPAEIPKKAVKPTERKLTTIRKKQPKMEHIALLGECLYLLDELTGWKRFSVTMPKGRKMKNLSRRIRAFLYN